MAEEYGVDDDEQPIDRAHLIFYVPSHSNTFPRLAHTGSLVLPDIGSVCRAIMVSTASVSGQGSDSLLPPFRLVRLSGVSRKYILTPQTPQIPSIPAINLLSLPPEFLTSVALQLDGKSAVALSTTSR